MSDFKSDIARVVSGYGFKVEFFKQSPSIPHWYQDIKHDTIPNFILTIRFWSEEHIQIEISGKTIKSPRNIDYYDSNKSIRNLKNRLKRLTGVAFGDFDSKQKTADYARAYKADIAEQIEVVNQSRQPNHNIVIDLDELEDDYKHLTIYYRSYELAPRLDEDGVVVFRETLFNKSKEFTLNDVVSLIDAIS